MMISDISTGKASLESLFEKKKVQKFTPAESQTSLKTGNLDEFEQSKIQHNDSFKMKDLQKSFLKNNLSLIGLQDLQKSVFDFEKLSEDTKDYSKISQELKHIVGNTKFEGENVISFLSTSIKDNKSLYTFKTNLNTEIDATKSNLRDERKKIASYLVKSENVEVAKNFSPDKTLKDIVHTLNKSNSENLFKGIANINNLIGIDH